MGMVVLLALVIATPESSRAQKSGGRVEGELLVKFGGDATSKSASVANNSIGASVIEEFPSIGWQHVRLPEGMSVDEGLARYCNLPGVVSAQPNYIYKTLATPNDPDFSQMYGMTKIQAPAAWDMNTGSSGVVVAVIDTGVLYTHEDLVVNMWKNPAETGLDGPGQH